MTAARLFDVVFGAGDWRQAQAADRVAPPTAEWSSPAEIFHARRRVCLLLRQGNAFFSAVSAEQRERWAQAFQGAAVGELMGGKLVELRRGESLFYFGILPAGMAPRLCGTIPPARQGLSLDGPGRPIGSVDDLPDVVSQRTRDAVVRALGHGMTVAEHLHGKQGYPYYLVETGVHDHWAPAGWLPLHSAGDLQWIVGVQAAVKQRDVELRPAPDPGLEPQGRAASIAQQMAAAAHAAVQEQEPSDV
jgi:hypothetical protein